MWELEISDVDLYSILNWFIIYSFFGWLYESTYCSIKEKKLINRGFVTGPFCTIYGVGAVSVYLILHNFYGNIIVLWVGGMVTATVLEYVTSLVMETVFHTRWWSYEQHRFNFKGRICLASSILWGFFTLLLFYVFQPVVEHMVSLYPKEIGEVAVLAVLIFYVIDLTISAVAAADLNKYLKRLTVIRQEFMEYVEKSRLYETKEELKERLEGLKLSEWKAELKAKLEQRTEVLNSYGKMAGISNYKEEIDKKIKVYLERYRLEKDFKNKVVSRFMKVYPSMRTAEKDREHTFKDLKKMAEKKVKKSKKYGKKNERDDNAM